MHCQLTAEHPDALTSMANLASTYCIIRIRQSGWRFNVQLEAMETRKKSLGAEQDSKQNIPNPQPLN
jgi:putative hemolysin